jgi:WXG100 family type VII secretion target
MTFSYSVDLELASRVVNSLAAVDSQLSDVVVDLRWRVAQLHQVWTGATAAAHLEAHESWCASYAEMHQALLAMRSVVRVAAANYSAASAANSSMWGGLR